MIFEILSNLSFLFFIFKLAKTVEKVVERAGADRSAKPGPRFGILYGQPPDDYSRAVFLRHAIERLVIAGRAFEIG